MRVHMYDQSIGINKSIDRVNRKVLMRDNTFQLKFFNTFQLNLFYQACKLRASHVFAVCGRYAVCGR